MKNSIQFITAVHGNELLPTLALASENIPQTVANPRALARGVRYTEKDLNASFGLSGNSYEEMRARDLTRLVDTNTPVVDFHTFSCVSEPFAIVVDPAYIPLASALGVKYVVYMKHNIKAGHALINYLPGVSVEVGAHQDPQSFKTALTIVHRLKKKISQPVPVKIYEVFGRIEEKGDYVNFATTKDFVPVLYGERAYDNQGFFGLKAKEITSTIQQTEDI